MRFTRIQLTNWKNFIKADVQLSRRVFIIGPNASGKSNFLEVFKFLRDLATPGGGIAEAVRIRGGIKKVRSVHARNKPQIQIVADIDGDDGTKWVYDLSFDKQGTKDSRPVLVRERVVRHDQGAPKPVVLLDRPNSSDNADQERLTQTAIEQTSANKDFRRLSDFFRSIQYIHLVPQLVREGSNRPSGLIGEDSMGRDLLDRMRDTPNKLRTSRLRRIQRVLEIAAPQFESLDLIEDNKGRPHLQVRFKHWRPTGAFQDESQFSDGTLRLIGLLWALQDKSGPLLLEEPELSLHAALLSKMAPFIVRSQKASDNRQVLVSTHSEHLLSDPGISPDEVLFVVPEDEGSTISWAGGDLDIQKKMLQAGLTASEAILPQTRTKQLTLFDKVTA